MSFQSCVRLKATSQSESKLTGFPVKAHLDEDVAPEDRLTDDEVIAQISGLASHHLLYFAFPELRAAISYWQQSLMPDWLQFGGCTNWPVIPSIRTHCERRSVSLTARYPACTSMRILDAS